MDQVSHIRDRVADRIGAARYRTWFGDSAEINLNDSGLDVRVANAFVGNWIATNYMDDLVASAQEVLGDARNISVRIVQDLPPQTQSTSTQAPPATPTATRPRASRTPATTSRATLRGKLDSFVVGSSNKLAFAAANQTVRYPGRAFKLLVVHGGCGLGKTHLLQGICNGLSAEHPTLAWQYISGEQFTNEFIFALKGGNVDLFRARYRNVDGLVIDDIHFLADKKATQDEFLHTFDAIDACGKVVVLSSDRHPRDIGTLSEPLTNRLIAGMVIEIEPPDVQVRREILRRRAQAMNADLPEEVVEYVAQHVTRNVRELEGTLYKLVALASLTQDHISLELARTAIDHAPAEPERALTAEELSRLVGGKFGVTFEQICSRSRDRTISLARAIAMYLVRRHTLLSFPEIGRALGRKNHSTVLMATQRVERHLAEDATVSWKTATGRRQAKIAELIGCFEQEIRPSRA